MQALSKSLEGLNLQTSQSLIDQWVSDNHEHIDGVVTQLSVTVEADQHKHISQMYLDSLYFPQIEERKSQIPEAHARTLRWVFDTPSADPSRWPDFAMWFKGSDNKRLYWITGKPGSGKSTLVRYLCDETRTKEHLEAWAGPERRLLTASCFFWNPGTQIQKSQAGLLRSLLHGLLQQCMELIPSVSPWRWRAYNLGAKQLDNWSDIELIKALETCVTAASEHAKMCVFVDGLDEFEGTEENRTKIIELLKRLAAAENVKVCVSSRPWRVFGDQFREYPTILLEKLNEHDIRMYVEDIFGVNDYSRRLKCTKERECVDLISKVTGKSEGVFLWVYLVVRLLLNGLRDHEKLSSLRERVDAVPGDLSMYFRQILEKIDPQHRKRAAAMFSIMPYVPYRLSVLSFSFLDGEETNFGLARLQTMPDDQMLEEIEDTTIRLKAWTKDLLEVHVIRYEGLLLRHKVEYLHRTVRDFLNTDETQQTLKDFSESTFDPDLYICNALLAKIKIVDVKSKSSATSSSIDDLLVVAQQLVVHLEVCEAHSPGRWCTEIRQELNLALYAWYGRLESWERCEEHPDLCWLDEEYARPSLLSFAAYWGLSGFISEVLQTLLLHPLNIQVQPLLFYSVVREDLFFYSLDALKKTRPPNVEVARLLLEAGADPNGYVQPHSEAVATVAQRFLSDAECASDHEAWLVSDSRVSAYPLSPRAQPWLDVTRLMIQAGMEDCHKNREITLRTFGSDESASLWLAKEKVDTSFSSLSRLAPTSLTAKAGKTLADESKQITTQKQSQGLLKRSLTR